MKRVVLVVLLAGLAWAWHERQALADFPGILSAYSAKEYCSCRFVMGFAETYCRGYVQQYLPLSLLEEDGARRLVTAEGMGRRNQAAWQGAREGCRLLP
ncbi:MULTISPECIES: amidase [Pseudomonas]|uniref:Amidase n=1 Tax=Pseudomonas mosselii TaxID=78327 RepID=A0A290GZ66_9PSED|nr:MULTISPECIES: amidase [Pseudomonas]MBC7210206.1 amidase [Pseudomonas sp.]ATB64515.1 amidase [Pseudomonas mosselii]KXG79698.1 amidase [Pseudomonas mosselii]MBA6064166.1 amidase [Pseudomonas mosselii]MBC3454623.1 amidase [Pseudomonas mosselii]